MRRLRGRALRERAGDLQLGVVRGPSNRRIGPSLSIPEAAVRRHLANVYAKTGIRSRSEAARGALKEGWIPLTT